MTLAASVTTAVAVLLLAPLAGGLLAGLDRRLTARLQSRIGPPVLQPFFDAIKLLGKEPFMVSTRQSLCAAVYLSAAAVSLVLLALGSDLLLIFFVQAVGASFMVVGAFSSPSPYSQAGAQRELLQMLAYEPLLILVFVGMAHVAGGFSVARVVELPSPLLPKLPLLFAALCSVLTIKLGKSPLDLASSHHAHQELVKGSTTDYSGPYLAMLEIGHWFESLLFLGFIALFWATSLTGAVLLVAIVYLAEILLDNVTARLTWRWMFAWVLGAGLVLAFVNFLWLTSGKGGLL